MGRKQEVGHFEHRISGRVEYLTPKWVTDLLGPFDLDPCASDPRPWSIAKTNYTADGLEQPWKGFVWLNPPYGRTNAMCEFIEKLKNHKDGGICLINSNTQTVVWHEHIFNSASAFFFLRGRISFATLMGLLRQERLGVLCLSRTVRRLRQD